MAAIHSPEPFSGMKLDAERLLVEAIAEHDPRMIFALFSGGDDSAVLISWAKRTIGHKLDAAVFIDTGTALPGVREFVSDFCANRYLPLLVYAAGDAFDVMVRERGFPGPAAHRYAYVRLKERQVDRLVREHKTRPRDRIMLLTGVRRAESTRRMGTVDPVRRDGAQVWVAPLVDWTQSDLRTYREINGVEQSPVAAMLHRSGECNCGAFAVPGEREMLRSLYPEWFEQRIAPLERACGRTWGERPPGERATAPGPMCTDCQLELAA